MFKMLWAEWNCKNCNKKISFNQKRRTSIALGFGILLVTFIFLNNEITFTPFWWSILIVLLLTGGVIIYTFDTFEKTE